MDQAQLNWLTNFIWNIADDVLRDVYVRGKYRDVILPMTVLRRLDAVLEPTKQAVLDMKTALDKEKIANQDDALRAASGQAFYNTSPFLLRDLKSRATQQKLKDDFEAYLDGFSPNVQDILTNFEFRNQIPRLSKADALGQLIEKFLDKDVNLSPNAVGTQPGLDNHSMGTMFEELVRRFNVMFLPVADKIESGTYLLYDCACGTGGMLTVAEETLQQIAKAHGKQVATHLYGQEINAETYAICKADLLLKGDGDAADNIVGGPEHSTLANALFENPASVRKALEKLVNDWGKGDAEEDEEEGESAKKTLSDKKKKKLLSEATWRRDAQLVETATKLRKALGGDLFEDHNVFLEKVEAALEKLSLNPSAADLKAIVNAVSWRVEDAPRVLIGQAENGAIEVSGRFKDEFASQATVKDFLTVRRQDTFHQQVDVEHAEGNFKWFGQQIVSAARRQLEFEITAGA